MMLDVGPGLVEAIKVIAAVGALVIVWWALTR